MNIEQVREYTLSLLGVTEDQPFGDDILTFRLEGKIFVCLWLGGGEHDMNVVDNELMAYAHSLADYYNERVGTFRPEQNECAKDMLDAILFDMVLARKKYD